MRVCGGGLRRIQDGGGIVFAMLGGGGFRRAFDGGSGGYAEVGRAACAVAAKAVDSVGRTFDLLLSDYKRREWSVGFRWRITARVHPVVGGLNLRGLNREAWALSNGIGGAGTVGATGFCCMAEAVGGLWFVAAASAVMGCRRMRTAGFQTASG